jgi:hypothetical protein
VEVGVLEGASVPGTGMVTTASVVAGTSASVASSLLPPMVTEQADNIRPASAAAHTVIGCLITSPLVCPVTVQSDCGEQSRRNLLCGAVMAPGAVL